MSHDTDNRRAPNSPKDSEADPPSGPPKTVPLMTVGQRPFSTGSKITTHST